MSDDKIEIELALDTDKFNAELENASKRVQQFMDRMSHMQARGFVGNNYKSSFPTTFDDSFLKNNQWTRADNMRTFFSKQSTGFLKDLVDAKADLAAKFSAEVGELSKSMNFDTKKWGKIVNAVGGGTSVEAFLKAPASSTGAYHPFEFNREGGLVAHSKALAKAVEQLGMEGGYSDTEIGDAIMASFVHDAAKYNDQGGYAANHDELVANILKAKGIDESIVDAVAGHMGDNQSRLGHLVSEADMLVSRPYASDFMKMITDQAGEEILGIASIDLVGLRKKAIEMGDLREDGRWSYHVLQEEKAKEKEWKAGKADREAAKYLQKEEEYKAKLEADELKRIQKEEEAEKRKSDAWLDKRSKERLIEKEKAKASEEDWWRTVGKEKEAEDKLFNKNHDKKQKELEKMFANEDMKKMKEFEEATKAGENSWLSMVTSVQKMMLLIGSLGTGAAIFLNKNNEQVVANTGELNSGLPGITGLTQYEQLVNKTASRSAGLKDGAMTGLAVELATKYAAFKTTGDIDALPAALANQLDVLYTDDSLSAQERLWDSLDTAYNNLSGMSKGDRSKQLSVLGSLFGVDGLSMLSYALEMGSLPSSFATNAFVTPEETADTAATSFELSAKLAEFSSALDDVIAGINNSVTELLGLPWADLKLKFFSFIDDTLDTLVEQKGIKEYIKDDTDLVFNGNPYIGPNLAADIAAGNWADINKAIEEGAHYTPLFGPATTGFNYKGGEYYSVETPEGLLNKQLATKEVNSIISNPVRIGNLFGVDMNKDTSLLSQEMVSFTTQLLNAGLSDKKAYNAAWEYMLHLSKDTSRIDSKVDVNIHVDQDGKVYSVDGQNILID